jgi:hypothetical protein
MIIRGLSVVLTSLASVAATNSEGSTANRLNPPTGRIDLKAAYAAPFLSSRSTSAGDGMETMATLFHRIRYTNLPSTVPQQSSPSLPREKSEWQRTTSRPTAAGPW